MATAMPLTRAFSDNSHSSRMLEYCSSLNSAHNEPHCDDVRCAETSEQDVECDALRSPGTPSVTAEDDNTHELGFLDQPRPPFLVNSSSTSLTLGWQPSSITGAASGNVANLNSRLHYQLEYQKVRVAYLSRSSSTSAPFSVAVVPIYRWSMRSHLSQQLCRCSAALACTANYRPSAY
jgi:hypothetical protein